ncbi:MAG: dihydropteroate synthase, partial [Bacteroidaceae bacterium]|nr:dihydropteroate synthase [Bacteroidaceae bacterium]
DPGFGFGKTLDHNYQLLARMDELQELQCPVLVGVSRKSMIYQLLGTSPQDALNGTTALNMLALMHGADILRVHDVKPCVETIKIYNKYKENDNDRY